MKNTIIAIAAFAATAAAQTGNAIVVNNCDYEVLVKNTPSDDGVHTEIDDTISANGGQYTQQYTELTNLMGWSLKMAPTEADFDAGTQNVAQYEYTNCGDGNIWFDMSFVDGSQWMNDWSVSSDKSGCSPSADNYFSDPTSANGMQAQCSIDVSITVTLCSSSGGGSGSSGSSSSSSAAASTSTQAASSTSSLVAYSTTSEAASSTSSLVAYSTTSAAVSSTSSPAALSTSSVESSSAIESSSSTEHYWTRTWNRANVVVTTATTPTTFATAVVTSVSSADTGDVIVTVTDVATAYATVVETQGAVKRRDQHQHHAARHPHAGRV